LFVIQAFLCPISISGHIGSEQQFSALQIITIKTELEMPIVTINPKLLSADVFLSYCSDS
jgi:hypothetical protein